MTDCDRSEGKVSRRRYHIQFLAVYRQHRADILTKEMRLPQSLEDVILKNIMDLPKTPVNQVKAVGTELRMNNIGNRRTVPINSDPTV